MYILLKLNLFNLNHKVIMILVSAMGFVVEVTVAKMDIQRIFAMKWGV